MAQNEFGGQKQELLVFWDVPTTRLRAKVRQDVLQHLVYFVHEEEEEKNQEERRLSV